MRLRLFRLLALVGVIATQTTATCDADSKNSNLYSTEALVMQTIAPALWLNHSGSDHCNWTTRSVISAVNASTTMISAVTCKRVTGISGEECTVIGLRALVEDLTGGEETTALTPLDSRRRVSPVHYIPSMISQLSNLQHMDITGAALSGTLPASITQLPSLKNITLSNSSISGVLPAALGEDAMKDFCKFDLSSTRLSGSFPQALMMSGAPRSWFYCKQIRLLIISGTQISGTVPIPDVSYQDSFLTVQWGQLWISRTRLSGTLSEILISAEQLSQLFVQNTPVSGTLPQLNQAMRSFAFAVSRVSGTLPTSYASLSSIEHVIGFNTSLRGDLSVIAGWSSLWHLISFECQLSGTVPSIRNSTNMRSMLLEGNQLSGSWQL